MEKFSQQSGTWDRFFVMYPNKNTKRLYSESMKKFLEFLFGSGCNLEEQADRYINSQRDFELDIIRYFNDALNKWSPKYLGLQRAAIKLFLEEYDITVPKRTWRRIAKQKPIYTIQEDRLPSRDELRRIFRHLPLHGKALFLIMLSGGTRIGETRKLRLQDIDWGSDPLLIKLPGEITKNKYPRTIFVSDEAKEVLKQWLANRDEYLRNRASKPYSKASKMAVENLVFPFHRNTALNIWRRALVKEGLDDKCPNTGTVKLRPHTLRKYFRTYHGAPVEVKEMLMGHRGYLTDQYVRYTVDDLRKAYRLGVSGVEIYGDSKRNELVKADLDAARRERDSFAKKLGVLEKEVMGRFSLTKEELMELYAETIGVGGGKSRKAEVRGIQDLDDHELNELFLTALRRKVLA